MKDYVPHSTTKPAAKLVRKMPKKQKVYKANSPDIVEAAEAAVFIASLAGIVYALFSL